MSENTQKGTNYLSNATVLYTSHNSDENTTKILKEHTKNLIILNKENSLEDYKKINENIDLIIADISSVSCFSFSLIKQIRASNDWKIPILVLLDLKDNSILTEIIKFKIENLMIKPFNEGTFLKIIDETILNISKTKLINQQKEHLEQFKVVLDKLNLVSETDLEGNITDVNQRFCEVCGYKKEELIGKTHKILRHPDISSEIYKKMWETIQSGKMWQGKLKNKAKNSEPYYIKLIIVPMKNDQGEICKYMSSGFLISDIEEEKQKLKRFIVNQKLDQMNTRKLTQEEINNKARDLVLKAKQDALEKEEKILRYLREMDEELKRLRVRREQDKKQIAFLEKEYKSYIENSDAEKKIFQERLEKVLVAGRKSYEKSVLFKKKCDALTIKMKRSQDGIKTLQGYVDEYRVKIDNLQDVIRAHERTIDELRKGSSS